MLLKALLNKEIYEKYYQYIDLAFLAENYPEITKLFKILPNLHQENTPVATVRSVADLELCYHTAYPQAQSSDLQSLLQDLRTTETSNDLILQYFKKLASRIRATKIAKQALLVSEGLADESTLSEIEIPTQIQNQDTSHFVTTNLHELYEHTANTPGLRWRIDSLNKALGGLRKGDFGFVFARPETGKTTFLASEISYMAGQTQNPILWFNNEEQGFKVVTRCYQATLGMDRLQLLGDRTTNYERYKEQTGDRIKVIADPSFDRKRVEELCNIYHPSLIIFDQIDKIKGFSDDRNDLELTAIYKWARDIANLHAPVIGVCQAGSSAEGKRWLTMNDVNNSKTGKQGEADWILGIGKTLDDSQEFVRFFHLSKNKLAGDLDTQEDMRHGKWEVKIRPDIARYEDY
ncbi:MAG: AAA family ATPase [Nitrosotalea sp.]